MGVTGMNGVALTNAFANGTTVSAGPGVGVYSGYPSGSQRTKGASQLEALASGASAIDQQAFDFSADSYAKHAWLALALTGTTAITIDFTAIAAATGVVIPASTLTDTTFATWNQIILVNTGAVDLTVNTGASNGLRLPNGGTSPTYTVPAGSRLVLESIAGLTVDSTHKTLTVTPTSGGSLSIGIAGA